MILITENLSTLKIHKLTQEQYDRERIAGRIDPSAIYLTPDEVNGSGGTSVFIQDDEPTGADTGTLWLDTDEEGSGGGSYEIPVFNLTEMGLPVLSLDGTRAEAETDTTALRAALASGLVKVTLNVYFNGYPVTVTAIDRAHYVDAEDTYQVCTMLHTSRNDAHYMHLGVFNVSSTDISACILPVAQEGKTPVKGVDYYTEEDKAEMVNAVLAALPDADLPKAETGVF